jgi:hypothetical protein
MFHLDWALGVCRPLIPVICHNLHDIPLRNLIPKTMPMNVRYAPMRGGLVFTIAVDLDEEIQV